MTASTTHVKHSASWNPFKAFTAKKPKPERVEKENQKTQEVKQKVTPTPPATRRAPQESDSLKWSSAKPLPSKSVPRAVLAPIQAPETTQAVSRQSASLNAQVSKVLAAAVTAIVDEVLVDLASFKKDETLFNLAFVDEDTIRGTYSGVRKFWDEVRIGKHELKPIKHRVDIIRDLEDSEALRTLSVNFDHFKQVLESLDGLEKSLVMALIKAGSDKIVINHTRKVYDLLTLERCFDPSQINDVEAIYKIDAFYDQLPNSLLICKAALAQYHSCLEQLADIARSNGTKLTPALWQSTTPQAPAPQAVKSATPAAASSTHKSQTAVSKGPERGYVKSAASENVGYEGNVNVVEYTNGELKVFIKESCDLEKFKKTLQSQSSEHHIDYSRVTNYYVIPDHLWDFTMEKINNNNKN